MKKLIITILFLLPAATALVLSGCKKQLRDLSGYDIPDDTKKDTLRCYNLLPDIGTGPEDSGYVFYLNDSIVFYEGIGQYALTFGVPPYVQLPATGGAFTVKLAKYSYYNDTPAIKNPPASRIILQTTFNVPPHSGFSNLIFYDDNGNAAVKFIPTGSADPGAPAPGKFKIRVINFGYAMTETEPANPENSSGQKSVISLRYADSTDLPGMSDLPFGTVSNYHELEYGTHQFWVYNSTEGSYIKNAGMLDDAVRTFDLYPLSPNPVNNTNRLFPAVAAANAYDQSDVSRNLGVGNVGSYPFAAGSCYTVLVIGHIYAVLTDRRYGDGVLDNFGKVQLVNTNFNQQKADIKISWSGGESSYPGLAFGQYTEPLTVPAGDVTVTINSPGNAPFTYTSQVFRLANFTWYYLSDLNNLPFILPENNVITADDYKPAYYSNPAVIMSSRVGAMNLSPDAGNIFFTHYAYLLPTAEATMTGDIPYKTRIAATTYDGTQPPARIVARLSSHRSDTLATRAVDTLTNVFPSFPAPGTYTLVAAGLLNTTDTAKAIHLFMIRHTNFIPKVKE